MSAAFTPGPWTRAVCRVEADGQTICRAELMRRPDYEDGAREAEANASLIAAAPDLYAALDALFKSYKRLADSGDAGNWSIEDQDEGKLALAALAKARGEPVLA